MNRLLLLIFFLLLSLTVTNAQVEVRLQALDEEQVNKFVEPLSRAISFAFNSGTYITADIPASFGFSLGATAQFIFIPEAQTKFTPDLPVGYNNEKPTATIFGNEGAYYAGPEGYIVYPPGINRNIVPAILPQAAVSFAGTRLLVRFLPPLDVGETEVSMFGFGLSHSISQYIPAFPIDLSVQALYSSLTVKDIAEQDNLAFNIHASKDLGLFTIYSGIQYEQSSMDLSYTFKLEEPVSIEREINASLDRTDHMRLTLGGALKLFIFRIHGDINAGPLFAFNTGVSIEM